MDTQRRTSTAAATGGTRTADELTALAEYLERIAAQYTAADIAESRYFAGVVSAHRSCATEARERAAALAGGYA